MYCYSNNGLGFRLVDENYTPVSGEYLSETVLNPQQIAAQFPSYASAIKPVQALEAAEAAMAGGITVTSIGNAELDGTYPVDSDTQAKLNSTITYIMLNNAFPPVSASSLVWYDIEGNPHTFTSVASFKAFATAFADFVAHVDIYANSGGETGSIPSNAITIP